MNRAMEMSLYNSIMKMYTKSSEDSFNLFPYYGSNPMVRRTWTKIIGAELVLTSPTERSLLVEITLQWH